jgi:hypothetical protein
MENGVKNLKGARLFPKTFSNHGFGDASIFGLGPYPKESREDKKQKISFLESKA